MSKEYYLKNKEEINRKAREYWLLHKEETYFRNKSYRKAHPDRIKKYSKTWALKHPETKKENYDTWRKKNPELMRRYGREWYQRNIAYKKNKDAKRRNVGGSFTTLEWIKKKEEFFNICPRCKRGEPTIKLTADHIIPIFKWKIWIKGHPEIKYKCNDIKNIQPLCLSCNDSKGTKIRGWNFNPPPNKLPTY